MSKTYPHLRINGHLDGFEPETMPFENMTIEEARQAFVDAVRQLAIDDGYELDETDTVYIDQVLTSDSYIIYHGQ